MTCSKHRNISNNDKKFCLEINQKHTWINQIRFLLCKFLSELLKVQGISSFNSISRQKVINFPKLSQQVNFSFLISVSSWDVTRGTSPKTGREIAYNVSLNLQIFEFLLRISFSRSLRAFMGIADLLRQLILLTRTVVMQNVFYNQLSPLPLDAWCSENCR